VPNPTQPERGVKSPYSARYGLSVPWCTGIDLRHDPSMLSDSALRQGVNCRIQDGVPVSRGGQSLEATSSPNGDCVQGMVDIPGAGTKMVLAANADAVNPAAIAFLDENLPAASRFSTIDDTVVEHPARGNSNGQNFEDTRPRYVYQWWDGHVVFQDAENSEKELCRIVLPEDTSKTDEIQVEPVFPCKVEGEMSTFTVSSLVTLPQLGSTDRTPLYFGTLGGGVVGYVNGQLVRLLAEATFSGRVIVFQYNNRLYAAGPQAIKVQNGWASGEGADSADWDDVAMPAGPSDFRPMCAKEWNGFGWIGGYDDGGSPPTAADTGYILKISDSTGTPVATVAINGYGGASDYLESVDDFAVGLANQFFVAWRWNSTTQEFASFGEWDGSSALNLSGTWGEAEATVVRMVGNHKRIYISGWGSDENGKIVSYDGSGETTVYDFGDNDETPFDMVLF
jgi:hypothetical protein